MTFLSEIGSEFGEPGGITYPTKKCREYPPPPTPPGDSDDAFFKGGSPLTSLFVLALTATCHLPGPSSFQSQCSALNRWLSIEPRTWNFCEQFL